jgi:hypothetical protein
MNYGHCKYFFLQFVNQAKKAYRFHAFGPLRYARITMDPVTGRSRGTGFACFWNKEDADKVVQQSELLRSETTGNEAVLLIHFLNSRDD